MQENYANLASIFLARIARSCTKSCIKNEAFLAKYKNLARKNFKIIFLQDLIKILQENYLAFYLAIFLQDFLYLARKASFLAQDLQGMCTILSKILQDKYLQDLYVSCKTVFNETDGCYLWLWVFNSNVCMTFTKIHSVIQ